MANTISAQQPVGQTSTTKTQTATKKYSDNNLIFTGMTIQQAYKNDTLLNAFKFADKNENNVIEDFEIERYNNPVIVKNYENNSTRVIDAYNSASKSGTVDSYITNSEQDFYPGLE